MRIPKEVKDLIERQYINEIEQVKEMGERIGYGNMMDIASILWAMNLKDHSGIDCVDHVSTILPFMKKKEAKEKEVEIRAKIKWFRRLLSNANN